VNFPDDAVEAFKEACGGLPRLRAAAPARLSRPPLEPNPWAVACPSCGAPAHVECRGVVSPRAVHARRMVDATAGGFRW
jgi:hypothetical protein